MTRSSEKYRKTGETEINVAVNLDGSGSGAISTGIGFFDHLLDAFKKHANFDMTVKVMGDLHVDGHHTVEDTGIVLGDAVNEALSDRRFITRFGHAFCPLDESLARVVVDISGRGFFFYENSLFPRMVGDFDGALLEEFLCAFAANAKITLHVALLYGNNHHHAYEAIMKACGRALKMATAIDPNQSAIPSTKGVL